MTFAPSQSSTVSSFLILAFANTESASSKWHDTVSSFFMRWCSACSALLMSGILTSRPFCC